MINTYVNKLIQNLPNEIKKKHTPIKLDIILDGGMFNGSYLVGALYFIKEMENRNFVKVERISGCSIGSIVGLLYFIDALDEFPYLYELLMNDFKKSFNLNLIKTLQDLLQKKIPSNICEILYKKLYITFNDIKHGKKKVKCTYRNKDEIFDSIVKSSYVPFMIDGNIVYKSKYIDGLNPYIFKNNKYQNKSQCRRILFIDLLGFDKISNTFNVKNEKTNFHRILSGMLDIHNFFIKNSQTQMCSYVDKWSLYNHFCMNIRYLIEKIIIYYVYILFIIDRYVSKEFKNILVYKLFTKIWKELMSTLFQYYCL